MMLLRMSAIAASVCVMGAAYAQVPVGPFVTPTSEKFDTMAVGAYGGFVGFAGAGTFSSIGAGGAMLVTNAAALLPPLSAPNSMFGRGVDVRIKLPTVHKMFGGYYRVPFGSPGTTMAKFAFYNGATFLGSAVLPISTAGYVWGGWDLSGLGGYDRVEIYGNGTIPGYVGMDNLYLW